MFNPFKFVDNRKLYKEALKDKEEIVYKDEQPPIRASLVNRRDVDGYTDAMIDSIEKDGLDIDYYASENFYKKNKMMNHGSGTYVISTCDDRDKFSKGYYNCTGVVAVGTDKTTGKQASFMSHQDPNQFLSYKTINSSFKKDLEKSLAELINNTEPGTVDTLVFGGQYPDDHVSRYKESIEYISKIIKDGFNIEPTVLTGPNISYYNDETDVYFDTQHRRLYLVRPYQENNSANESYLPNDYKKQEEKWFAE